MPGTSPVLLILGAGPNIGHSVSQIFAPKGYKVALAARSLKEADSTENQLNITTDLAKTDDVVNAFEKVNKVFGTPSVVIYNVSASTLTPPDDPFSLPLDAFTRDVTINVTSAFVAAQQAAVGFARLPTSASRTFIYTGNILNIAIIPGFLDQGVGKSAGAYMIRAASAAYKERGFKYDIPASLEKLSVGLRVYRFYYADERKADGTAKYRVDGEAHGKFFWELAETNMQGPWLATFVKGEGYKNFGPYELEGSW